MKKLWFKRKLYGWGWTPSSWEGWAVILLYMILVLGIPLGLAFFFDADEYPNNEVWFALAAILSPILLTVLLVWISYKKGEKPKWQWGEREEGDE